jgi:hypothetical protein
VLSGKLEKEVTKTEALHVFIETIVLLRYPIKAPIFPLYPNKKPEPVWVNPVPTRILSYI